jgi:hypothetical protein
MIIISACQFAIWFCSSLALTPGLRIGNPLGAGRSACIFRRDDTAFIAKDIAGPHLDAQRYTLGALLGGDLSVVAAAASWCAQQSPASR